jgi:hypothetical protein
MFEASSAARPDIRAVAGSLIAERNRFTVPPENKRVSACAPPRTATASRRTSPSIIASSATLIAPPNAPRYALATVVGDESTDENK